MGFFKSVHDLHKQAKEIDKNWDVKSQLSDAQTKMAQANEMMAEQTRSAALATTGLDAGATVVAVRQTPATINMQPVCEIDMTIMAPGRPPYPATVRQTVPLTNLAALQPGARLRVKTDPADPASVWVDLVGSAVY